jgi:hypothetical protein
MNARTRGGRAVRRFNIMYSPVIGRSGWMNQLRKDTTPIPWGSGATEIRNTLAYAWRKPSVTPQLLPRAYECSATSAASLHPASLSGGPAITAGAAAQVAQALAIRLTGRPAARFPCAPHDITGITKH